MEREEFEKGIDTLTWTPKGNYAATKAKLMSEFDRLTAENERLNEIIKMGERGAVLQAHLPKPSLCPDCRGAGRVWDWQDEGQKWTSPNPVFLVKCPWCKGEGILMEGR